MIISDSVQNLQIDILLHDSNINLSCPVLFCQILRGHEMCQMDNLLPEQLPPLPHIIASEIQIVFTTVPFLTIGSRHL